MLLCAFTAFFHLLSLSLFLAGALQITASDVNDQGKYECVANNSVGTEYSKSAMLYVKGKVRREVTRRESIPPGGGREQRGTPEENVPGGFLPGYPVSRFNVNSLQKRGARAREPAAR